MQRTEVIYDYDWQTPLCVVASLLGASSTCSEGESEIRSMPSSIELLDSSLPWVCRVAKAADCKSVTSKHRRFDSCPTDQALVAQSAGGT